MKKVVPVSLQSFVTTAQISVRQFVHRCVTAYRRYHYFSFFNKRSIIVNYKQFYHLNRIINYQMQIVFIYCANLSSCVYKRINP